MSHTKHHSEKTSFERKAKKAFSTYRKKYREALRIDDWYIELPIQKKTSVQ